MASNLNSRNFESYTGGKSGSGVYQRIISLMPPHKAYIELFLGSGAILRRKRPALINIGLEIDKEVFQQFPTLENTQIKNLDAFAYLEAFFPQNLNNPETVVYADPPYLGETRGNRAYYNHELLSKDAHIRLLELLKKLKCKVLISGYDSALYNELLDGWRIETIKSPTRGGWVEEKVWCNFPIPSELHDYSFLGSDYRQRQNLKRKRERWLAKLAKMDALERYSLLDALESFRQAAKTALPDHR